MSEQHQQQEMAQAYGEYVYEEQNPRPRKRRKDRGFWKFLLFLCVVTAGLIVLLETCFTLEMIRVIGNTQADAKYIINVSGLVSGRSMIGIEEKEVADAFASDHTLIFKGMQKEYPNTIYLYVEERQTVASLQCRGTLYTLDKEGLVMTRESSAALPAGMPVITGLDAHTVNVGQKLTVGEDGQLEAYICIMDEMSRQQCFDQFSEVSLADPANIFLVTVEGVTVRAGDKSNMQAKIGAVRTTMAYLRQLGKKGGILDVTHPKEPKYMPEN